MNGWIINCTVSRLADFEIKKVRKEQNCIFSHWNYYGEAQVLTQPPLSYPLRKSNFTNPNPTQARGEHYYPGGKKAAKKTPEERNKSSTAQST